ncbi:MAG TPA: hypothetical protein VE422_08970 [Terriglobia bacterium]|nr:hypothetical protein [Terriglobia bacterium]
MNTRIDVALILWNTDVIQLVSLVLRHRNLKSRGVEPSQGPEKIQDLIVSCSPSVVVFDLGPPYDESAAVVLRLLGRFPDPSFVITCADPALALKAAPWLSCYPIFQKPYPPDEIGETVGSMVRRVSRNRAWQELSPGVSDVTAKVTESFPGATW